MSSCSDILHGSPMSYLGILLLFQAPSPLVPIRPSDMNFRVPPILPWDLPPQPSAQI